MGRWLDEPDSEAAESLGEGLGLPDLPSSDGYGTPELEVTADEEAAWTPELGFPDSTQSVRLWVDGSRRLTKVVISNKWRERAQGTSLSSMFDEAFLLAMAQLPDEASPWQPVVDGTDPEPISNEPLTWEAVLATLREVDRLNAKVEELNARPPDEVEQHRWVGDESVGVSDNRMVSVTLDLYGHTRKVDFNEHWLHQSRVSEVCDAVMQAHRQAYSLWQPPTFVPGEHAAVAREAHRLTQQTMALMRQGGTR